MLLQVKIKTLFDCILKVTDYYILKVYWYYKLLFVWTLVLCTLFFSYHLHLLFDLIFLAPLVAALRSANSLQLSDSAKDF